MSREPADKDVCATQARFRHLPSSILHPPSSIFRFTRHASPGAIPYDPGYLLVTTNLAAPLADWTCVGTNYFNDIGVIRFTNSVSADRPQQYFRLRVD